MNALRLIACRLLPSLSLLLAFTSCESLPIAVEPFEIDLSHRPGGVLNNPVARAIDPEAEAWGLVVKIERFDELRPEGRPLAERVERALVLPGEQPLRTRGELGVDVLTIAAPPPMAPRFEQTEQAFLWPGSTVVWNARPKGEARTPREHFGLEIGRPTDADTIELAIVLHGAVVPRVDEDELDEDQPMPILAPVDRIERLVLDPVAARGRRAPAPVSAKPAAALARSW